MEPVVCDCCGGTGVDYDGTDAGGDGTCLWCSGTGKFVPLVPFEEQRKQEEQEKRENG